MIDQGEVGVGKELFVEIRFSVVVVVVETDDAAAGGDKNFPIDDLAAKRFVNTGGITAPGHFAEGIIDAGDDPDIAVVGGDDSTSVVEECQRCGTHPAVIGVVERHRDSVQDVTRLLVIRQFTHDVIIGGPAAFTSAGLCFEVDGFQCFTNGGHPVWRAIADASDHGKRSGFLAGRDVDGEPSFIDFPR